MTCLFVPACHIGINGVQASKKHICMIVHHVALTAIPINSFICHILIEQFHYCYIRKYYRIAGNCQGTKFSMITSFQLFANKFSGVSTFTNNLSTFINFLRILFLRIHKSKFTKTLKFLSLENFHLYTSLTI